MLTDLLNRVGRVIDILLAMALAQARLLQEANGLVQGLAYALLGMIWIFYLFLLIVFGLIVLYVVEAWIDLDRWLADAPNREANGYREYVNNPTPTLKPEPKIPEPVSILTAKPENFTSGRN